MLVNEFLDRKAEKGRREGGEKTKKERKGTYQKQINPNTLDWQSRLSTEAFVSYRDRRFLRGPRVGRERQVE